MAKIKAGDVHIEGQDVTINGDIVGRDHIVIGVGGEVACDFLWRGKPIKALCFPEDQRNIQKLLDKVLSNNPDKTRIMQRVKNLSPNLHAQIERIENERGDKGA